MCIEYETSRFAPEHLFTKSVEQIGEKKEVRFELAFRKIICSHDESIPKKPNKFQGVTTTYWR